jgi:hypothetical protein
MAVIDIHTHIVSQEYVDLLNAHGGPSYEVEVDRSGGPAVHRNGAPFMTLSRGMFDVDERLDAMETTRSNLVASVGFMLDTSLAVAHLIYDGLLDRYPNLELIAAHAGATLPLIGARIDRCHEMMPACRERIAGSPSTYLRRIYYDSV